VADFAATNDQRTRTRRHRSSSHSSRPTTRVPRSTDGWGAATEVRHDGIWLGLTDLGILAVLFGTTVWFGGRTPVGQLFLLVACVTTALCWSIHAWASGTRRWIWTGSEGLWLLAALIPASQLVPLPAETIASWSPRTAELLPLWGAEVPGNPLETTWSTLTFSPAATRGGLQLFLAYTVWFLTLVQRLRTADDAYRLLRWIAAGTIGWALFGLLQYGTANGKFYWVVEHPFSSTSHFVTGSFTNRNHYAHLLALGLGPLFWCVATSWLAPERPHDQGFATAPSRLPAWGWTLGLIVTLTAILLSLSRGGLLAAVITVVLASLLVVPILAARQRSLSLVIFAVLLVTCGIGYAGFDKVVQRAALANDQIRLAIWEANTAVWQDFPLLGTGVGTHTEAHHTRLKQVLHNTVYTHAESSIFQVASETGTAGLMVTGLMILAAVYWLFRGWLTSRGTETSRAASAALLAGLVGHLVHAIADFVWYVPACMVTVVALVACGFAFRRQVSPPEESPERTHRFAWTLSAIGAFSLLVWAGPTWQQAAQAEPRMRDYIWLAHRQVDELPADDDEARRAWEYDKARVALQAAKANPVDPQTRMLLAEAYVRVFNQRQLLNDPPFTLTELKDVVAASNFASADEAKAWLTKVAGKNTRYLDLAWRQAVAAVRAAPLQAPAYLTLMELSFLHDPSGKLEADLMEQTRRLRPHDPEVMFLVGQRQLLAGDREAGLKSLIAAYRGSPPLQPRIAKILVSLETPDVLIRLLEPDEPASGILAVAYAESGQTDEAARVYDHQIRLAREAARRGPTVEARVEAWIVIYQAEQQRDRPEAAIAALETAITEHPQVAHFRMAIARLLAETKRLPEGVDHLRWLTARYPDEPQYQTWLTAATTAARVTPVGHWRAAVGQP
jgi:O-antigen ligase